MKRLGERGARVPREFSLWGKKTAPKTVFINFPKTELQRRFSKKKKKKNLKVASERMAAKHKVGPFYV